MKEKNDYISIERRLLKQRYCKMVLLAKKLNLGIMLFRNYWHFSQENQDFRHSYYDFYKSGFNKKLSPVIERIDKKKGFIEGNLKWVIQKNKNRSHGQAIIVSGLNIGERFYFSARRAEMELELPKGVISRALRTGKSYKNLRVKSVDKH